MPNTTVKEKKYQGTGEEGEQYALDFV